MEIVDTDGSTVVEYGYDAWGKNIYTRGSKAEGLGRDNPFRYRGYVYDGETELYYLRSRYYEPEWGRFLNADSVLGSVGGLLSHNLFAYCKNVPVALCDKDGCFSISTFFLIQTLAARAFTIHVVKDTIKKTKRAAVKRAMDDFNERFGDDLFLVPISVGGAKPISVTLTDYTVKPETRGWFQKAFGFTLGLLSAEGMGDTLTYAAMVAGIPIDGGFVEDLAGVVDFVIADVLNIELDTYTTYIHTIYLEYSYADTDCKTYSYMVFESGAGASPFLHIFGSSHLWGWWPLGRHDYYLDMRG